MPSGWFSAVHRGDALEEERVVDDTWPLAEPVEHGPEGSPVLRPEIGRRIHPGQQDRDAPGGQRVQDRCQVRLDDPGIDPPKPVIGAELHDRRIRLVGERPVEPRPAPRRRVAGYRAVQHLHIVALRLRAPPGAAPGTPVVRQAVPGGQRIAEYEKAQRSGGGRESRDDQQDCAGCGEGGIPKPGRGAISCRHGCSSDASGPGQPIPGRTAHPGPGPAPDPALGGGAGQHPARHRPRRGSRGRRSGSSARRVRGRPAC